jgi:hypothetical protein
MLIVLISMILWTLELGGIDSTVWLFRVYR